MRKCLVYASVTLLTVAVGTGRTVMAQTPRAAGPPAVVSPAAPGVTVPTDFVIGPEDVLGVLFWRDSDMSGDVTVRPDGIITLPLLGEIRAAGLRPDALAEQIQKASNRFLTEPNVTIVVRQINSRKVFITGQVATPGAYPLIGPRTVMQLIALAGGLTEYADSNNILVIRTENGIQRSFKFSYKGVATGKTTLTQNRQLMPGDTVVVP